jgi:hypothetical protein
MSKTAYVFAALSLAIAAPAFAAGGGHLGVDVSGAGKTKEEHTAFFEKLDAKDRGTVQQECMKQVNMLSDHEKSFCESVKN